jgi:hypothetical protein
MNDFKQTMKKFIKHNNREESLNEISEKQYIINLDKKRGEEKEAHKKK